ncbi:hypothetical protein LINPERHAP1_LOCUS25044 [Linum perenne]
MSGLRLDKWSSRHWLVGWLARHWPDHGRESIGCLGSR